MQNFLYGETSLENGYCSSPITFDQKEAVWCKNRRSITDRMKSAQESSDLMFTKSSTNCISDAAILAAYKQTIFLYKKK